VIVAVARHHMPRTADIDVVGVRRPRPQLAIAVRTVELLKVNRGTKKLLSRDSAARSAGHEYPLIEFFE
jgi:hypothetical protein